MKHPYLLILLAFFPIVLAADCAPAPSFYGYRFLNPAMVEYDSQLSPFYESFREYYPEAGKKGTNYQKQDNLAEWHERYCEQVDTVDLEKTIYGSSVNDLQELLRVLSRPKTNVASLPDRLQRNTFTNHLMRYKCTEVVEYLLFAKQAEPLVGSNRSGFKQNEPRRVDMERLIDDGLEKFRRTKSHYVRLRYAYQLIRLAHYLKEYSYVLELHDYLMPKIEADPIINDLENSVQKPNTKMFANLCKDCGILLEQKLLIIVSNKTEAMKLATRNLKNVELIAASNLNTLSLLKAKSIILTPLAISDIKEIYCG